MSRVQHSGYETWGEKFTRKVKENPWVPLGCLATTGALVMSAVKMRAGQSKQMNYWMRARVGLQGVTLVALVAGSLAIQSQRKKALEEPDSEANKELALAKVKESEEFEERLKGAEVAHGQEAGLVAKVVKGPTVVKHDHQAPQTTSTPSPLEPSIGSKKSWWKLW